MSKFLHLIIGIIFLPIYLFSETVLADMAGDTISTEFYTSQLVEALFDLKEISNSDY